MRTPTCELPESGRVEDVEVMHAERFPQGLADVRQFPETFPHGLVPLRHLRHQGFLFFHAAGVFRFHEVDLWERKGAQEWACAHVHPRGGL